MKIQALIEALETLAPVSLAESWDATGLQVGDPGGECEAILLCLDVSEAVLEEAIQDGANLIVSHHPMLFTPLKSLDIRSKTGRLIKKCLSSGLTVYSMHTNLDKAEGGMNDYAAGLLGLRDVSVLESSPPSDSYFKLVTFVPKGYRESLLQALFEVGGGRIGGYKECSFSGAGEGTFLPGEEASPAIGEKGILNRVPEDRVEVLFSSNTLQRGIAALKSAHPYEVPAFDVYPLVSTQPGQGYVRVGTLPPPSSWNVFLGKVQGTFNLSDFRVIGDKVETVSRVALCTGSGASFISQAARVAEVYITGDIKYHEAQEAQALGLTVIDAGHFAMERIFVDLMDAWFKHKGLKSELKVFKSLVEHDPFTFFHVGGNH